MPLRFDLLAEEAVVTDSPVGFAASLAREKFQDQVRKSGGMGRVRSASLVLEREGPKMQRFVNGQPRNGYMMRITVRASANTTVEVTVRIFVAPHNPFFESQSWRGW